MVNYQTLREQILKELNRRREFNGGKLRDQEAINIISTYLWTNFLISDEALKSLTEPIRTEDLNEQRLAN